MKPRIRTYRRIFAILVLIDKAPAIHQFIREGVNDSDLPLVRSGTEKDMRRSRALDKELKCFGSGWTGIQIRNFVEYQWTTLAPFFSKSEERKEVRHYPLQDRVILPFSPNKKQGEVNEELLGGGGRVFKTGIHPDHHNFHAFFDCPRAASPPDHGDESPECTCVFAIKCLHSQDKESFKKEVDMLKKFSNNAHPNLISLLATYEQNGTFFLIFPCADDDLQTYWKKMPPPPPGTPAAIVGNHGDIKPENVLWFRDITEARSDGRSSGRGRGTLKLSDFGLADSSSSRTASRRFHSNVAVTCNYRAPECDLPNQGGKGRQYDMWTLGCLYLEFVTWLVGGTALLDEFVRERLSVDMAWYEIETDTFFHLDKDPETKKLYAVVKPSVTAFIQRLRSERRCTPFILDFLDLIETGLLVVKNPKPFVKGRLSINEAHARLTKMVQKCNTEREYACKSLYYMSASQGVE
ncbi:kinase-like domain-containing protein [Lasiosphaeria miniovina]|uniref:Kinase-like domain-containing protein n=1 Tax=Lasiosphaeria miniovina TaxID=1954250 RepID=A0AA40DU86_9PEZI|nr:kinase-like domain-containing protein [Lasiosphaeria miniovina]KAK0713436.1 kinase-like domain-containing protein [Lasiosphaeria miniovina]